MTAIGINYFSHDTSVAFQINNNAFALEEERPSRKKHAAGFWLNGREPANLLNQIFRYNKIDKVIHGWAINKFTPFYLRLTSNFITSRYINFKLAEISRNFHESLKNINRLKKFEERLKNKGIKLIQIKHHLSHASHTFRLSRFRKSSIMVLDGNGEDESISFWYGKNKEIEQLESFPIWKSIGKLYTRGSNILGMGIGGEGKTMALATFAKPHKKFSFVEISKDDFKILWEKLKLVPPRMPYEKPKNIHATIAATLQQDLERISLFLLEKLIDVTGNKHLCLGGGVALNCQLNSFLFKKMKLSKIYIPSAPNDSGVSLGAFLEYSRLNNENILFDSNTPFFGYDYPDEYVENVLIKYKKFLNFQKTDDIEGILAQFLSSGKVCALFQGRMEFGPRALGNRSILGHPGIDGLKDKINLIKGRELWQPLAPAILEEKTYKYFKKLVPSYMMTFVFDAIENRKEDIINVLHNDNSARLQMVNKKFHPSFYKLIKNFYKLTDIPMVINTSFNLKNEPIVMSPEHAIDSFLRSNIDFLAIENFLVKKR